MSATFSAAVLEIDARAVADHLAAFIKHAVLGPLRRRGVVVGLSGGVDSAVVAALGVQALGRERVFGLLMPERDSSPDALRLGRLLADSLGIESAVEDIGPALDGAGCYRKQLAAIRSAVPEYGEGWRCKLGLPSILDSARLNITRLTVESPAGEVRTVRLGPAGYLQMVAATNYKQRFRTTTEYYHADRLNYAVAGTPNRLEYDQGFFVKQGDGAADLKPIAHLYKTQVYALARHFGVPEEIRRRPPTTDTFSLAQTQEEFYFALPHAEMDLCLYALNAGVAAGDVAPVVQLTPEQVQRVFNDIRAKRRATRCQHLAPLLAGPGPED